MLKVLCAVAPNTGWAQSAIALDRFEPAAPTSNLISVAEPIVRGKLVAATGFWLTYADSPLVLVRGSAGRRELADVVDHQLLLHLGASLSLARRFEFGVNLPWIMSQGGDSPTISGATYASPTAGALGDLRLSGRVGAFAQRGYLPGVGLLASAWLPTGRDSAYAGAGQFRLGADLLLGADFGPFLWRAALGRRHQNDDAVLPTAHSGWVTSLGVAYRKHQWQLGPELWASTVADGRVSAFSRRGSSVEAILALRYRWTDLLFSAAAGPGLAAGPGTPHFRGLLGIAYAPQERDYAQGEPVAVVNTPIDPDAQNPARILASRDATTSASAAVRAIEPDSDSDGIRDTLDACPNRFGAPNVDRARNGCPLDTDSDGIMDTNDACPNDPGPANNQTERHGCPSDRDGDGILDRDDACPDVNGQASSDPKQHGCKSAVTIQGAQFILTQQIHFKTGSDEILRDSQEVLLQLKQLLTEAPEIARVAIDGHTDDVGPETRNLSLSRRRALAVVRWLVNGGIDERRLEARGYGPRQPLVANDSGEGRAKNRRVEFIILRRSDAGVHGWTDGTVHE